MATDAADPWGNLSPDLVRLIAGKLTDICDYIRFRCICHSWRSSTGTADYTNRFLPWTIYSCRTNTTKVYFVNVSDGRSHLLRFPQVKGKWIYGSSHGWLVMIGPPPSPLPPRGPATVSLLNPLTRAQIDLPPLPKQLTLYCFPLTNALLCSHPISSQPGQLLVAVWDYFNNSLAIFKQGDNDWILFSSKVKFQDIAYFDGALYSVDSVGRLALLDVATSEARQLVEPQPPSDYIFANLAVEPVLYTEYAGIYYSLAESNGDLFLLPRYFGIREQLPLITFIFKLDMSGNGERKWVKVAGANGRNLIYFFRNTNLPSDDPNEYPFYTDDTVAGIRYGISTGKFHYLQTWSRESWLVPSLY